MHCRGAVIKELEQRAAAERSGNAGICQTHLMELSVAIARARRRGLHNCIGGIALHPRINECRE